MRAFLLIAVLAVAVPDRPDRTPKEAHLKLHGKMLLADEKRAIVGSINLTPGSFDARRELAIETDARHVIERLVKVSHHDWKHSRKLDLSDEGILADFEKHGTEGADKLAIEAHREKHPTK